MADNTTLNVGTLGSVMRDIDKGGVHTQVVTLDLGGSGAEALVAGTVPVSGTVTANATLAAETTKVIGTVNLAAAQTLATVSSVTAIANALPAGTNNIGDVDVLTVPADPFGVNADAASATGSISAKLRFIAATGIPITGTVTVGSHAVTNAGTFAVQNTAATPAGTNNIGDIDVLTLPDYMGPFVPETRFTNDTAATSNENVTTGVTGLTGTAMWIANESTTPGEMIYFKFGTSSQDATSGAVQVVYPGTFGTFQIPTGTTNMAFASAAGTPAFKYMRGTGSV